jgi:hypothetical protein
MLGSLGSGEFTGAEEVSCDRWVDDEK